MCYLSRTGELSEKIDIIKFFYADEDLLEERDGKCLSRFSVSEIKYPVFWKHLGWLVTQPFFKGWEVQPVEINKRWAGSLAIFEGLIEGLVLSSLWDHWTEYSAQCTRVGSLQIWTRKQTEVLIVKLFRAFSWLIKLYVLFFFGSERRVWWKFLFFRTVPRFSEFYWFAAYQSRNGLPKELFKTPPSAWNEVSSHSDALN